MNERMVINTGPIIALARGQALGILDQLAIELVCPAEVEAELKRGVLAGHPFQWPDRLQVVLLATSIDPLAGQTLDIGEAAVIQLATEQSIPTVCIDDRKGRRAALAVGLNVVGSLGLLARAKLSGIIPSVRSVTNRSVEQGVWYHPTLLDRVLRELGE